MTLPKRFRAYANNGREFTEWHGFTYTPPRDANVVQWTGIDDLYEGDICITKICVCTDALPFTGEPETEEIEIKGEIIFKDGMFILKGYEGRYELVLPGREIKKVGNKFGSH